MRDRSSQCRPDPGAQLDLPRETLPEPRIPENSLRTTLTATRVPSRPAPAWTTPIPPAPIRPTSRQGRWTYGRPATTAGRPPEWRNRQGNRAGIPVLFSTKAASGRFCPKADFPECAVLLRSDLCEPFRPVVASHRVGGSGLWFRPMRRSGMPLFDGDHTSGRLKEHCAGPVRAVRAVGPLGPRGHGGGVPSP